MSISGTALSVIKRPLDRDRVKQRKGKGGKVFDYISADYVISLLNEAFDYRWDTRIISHSEVEGSVVVALELTVWDIEGNPITKQQFGSCDILGVGHGDAFKGAASDALKKCATLVGVGLELYYDETVSVGNFTPPSSVASQVPRTSPNPPKTPATSQVSDTTFVPKPNIPRPPHVPRPDIPKSVPVAKPVEAGVSRVSPFSKFVKGKEGQGPSPTQLNALKNLAEKRGLGQAEMIALVGVVDGEGNSVRLFEDLTHAQAIDVIKAAQL